jgi:hypothetical protein
MAESSANARINHLWERLALGLIGILMLWGATQFQDLKEQNKELENKVLFLYTDKVSTAQLKDTEDRLIKQIDGMKADILARLDYIGAQYKQR